MLGDDGNWGGRRRPPGEVVAVVGQVALVHLSLLTPKCARNCCSRVFPKLGYGYRCRGHTGAF